MTWTQKHGIKLILIEPVSPTQNAYIKSFNGTFRDECLDENLFESLEQVRLIIATCRTDCNETRLQSSCVRMPLKKFAALHRQLTGDVKREREQDRCRNKLTLQTSHFWNLDWYRDWGKVSYYSRLKL